MGPTEAHLIPGGESEKLDMFVDESSRLLGELSLPGVLTSILELAARSIPVDAYCIWRCDPRDAWTPVLSKGLSDTYLRQRAAAGPREIPSSPVIFHDLGAHPLLTPRSELYAAEGIRALAAMPLTIQGRVDGTLVFYRRDQHRFDALELKLASALANLAGAAITSAELAEQQSLLLREKELSQQSTAFLAQASQILASSLDYETTLSAVAHLAIGFMADWCMVDIADQPGAPPRQLAVAHIDPVRRAWAQELHRLYPPKSYDATAMVIESGKPLLAPVIEDAQLAAAARDPEHLRLLRELAPRSFICVPMWARGKTLGSLSFLITQSERRYSEADLVFAQDLASRCALAIDNARLYTAATESAALEKESRTEVETLNRVARILAAELNLEKLVQAVTDAAIEITGAQFGSFLHANRPGPEFPPVKSYLAVPIISRSGELLGELAFAHSEPGRFTPRHQAIITGIARHAATALDNARLFERSEWAQKELKRSNEDLRRANRDLETFAYSASHDLQEPLRHIAISAQLFHRSIGSTLYPEQMQLLEAILDGSERMRTLLQDLLTYTQAIRDTDGPVSRVFVGNIIAQVLETLKSRVDECAAVVTWEDMPAIAMHEVHVKLLFQNLIGNALKYCRSDAPRVHISAIHADGCSTFSIADNGIGIEPQYADQIFGLFKRLHTREDYPGTGIGLAICQRILEQYGGRIWLEKSTPGVGSTFCFQIPE